MWKFVICFVFVFAMGGVLRAVNRTSTTLGGVAGEEIKRDGENKELGENGGNRGGMLRADGGKRIGGGGEGRGGRGGEGGGDGIRQGGKGEH